MHEVITLHFDYSKSCHLQYEYDMWIYCIKLSTNQANRKAIEVHDFGKEGKLGKK